MLAGEAACLAAAFLWAFTVALFRAPIEKYGARTINLAKCVIATAMLAVTVLVLGQSGLLRSAPTRDLLLIAASGLVGLTLGDTALFAAVRRIGVYRALLLQTMAPVFTAALAVLWQGERLGGERLSGMDLTLAGISLVVSPQQAAGDAARPNPQRIGGIVLGILAAIGQAGGIVLSKAGMASLPSLHASLVRLAAAAAGLIVVGILDGRLRRAVEIGRSPRDLGRIVPAAILGTYVGIFLMMFGISKAPAAVAAVLLSTTPVFSLFLGVATGRERLTVRAVAGTLLAVAGIGVLSI